MVCSSQRDRSGAKRRAPARAERVASAGPNDGRRQGLNNGDVDAGLLGAIAFEVSKVTVLRSRSVSVTVLRIDPNREIPRIEALRRGPHCIRKPHIVDGDFRRGLEIALDL